MNLTISYIPAQGVVLYPTPRRHHHAHRIVHTPPPLVVQPGCYTRPNGGYFARHQTGKTIRVAAYYFMAIAGLGLVAAAIVKSPVLLSASLVIGGVAGATLLGRKVYEMVQNRNRHHNNLLS